MNTVESTGLVLAQGGPPSMMDTGLIPLALILAVFYFLLIRPQQKRAKEHKALVDGLKKNDQVVTTGGLYGRIVEVSENVVTVEIAPNVNVRHERSQIGSVVKNGKG